MVGVCVLEHLEDPPAVFSHAQGAEVCFVVPSYFSHMRVWGFRGGTAAAEWLEQWVKVDRKIPLITLPNRPGFQLWALEGVVR